MEIKKGKYKLILFDLDLTLLDSRESAKLCYEAAHEAVGDKFNENDLLHFLGVPLDTSYAEIKVKKGSFEKYCEVFEEHAQKTIVPNTRFYEDGLRLIKKLKEAGIAVGILSNRSRFVINELLHKEEILLDTIKFYVGNDDVKRTKPDPEPFYCALKKSGLNNKEIVYIGDAKNDYLACKAANVDFICVNRYGICDFECDKIESLDDINLI